MKKPNLNENKSNSIEMNQDQFEKSRKLRLKHWIILY